MGIFERKLQCILRYLILLVIIFLLFPMSTYTGDTHNKIEDETFNKKYMFYTSFYVEKEELDNPSFNSFSKSDQNREKEIGNLQIALKEKNYPLSYLHLDNIKKQDSTKIDVSKNANNNLRDYFNFSTNHVLLVFGIIGFLSSRRKKINQYKAQNGCNEV